ncbi:MAG: hypothetical protein HZA20_09350 [Nitrospirae bacterium]|nr:hypothetical protein [Nitrospirota bacterium]
MRKFVPVVCSALLLMLVSGFGTMAYAARSWEFVYQHDENGNPVSGSLSDLIGAIDDGAEVRVVHCNQQSNGNYFESLSFTYVAVNHIPGHVTAVQFRNNTYLDPSTKIWNVVNVRRAYRTDGIAASQIDGQPEASESTRICMKWYVNR